MRIFIRICIILLFTLISGILPAGVASEGSLPVTADQSDIPMGYALIMANGSKIKVSEYSVDLDNQSVFYKSQQSGLAATFPLERIRRIVKYDTRLAEVPDDAMPTFIPEVTIDSAKDDGGIPILFKVTTSVVGGGGGSDYSRAGGSRSQDHRKDYRGSSSGGSSSSRTSSSRTSGSTSSSSSSSKTSSSKTSSSSGSADNFFNALFSGS